MLANVARRQRPDLADCIVFMQVSKSSQAHDAAIRIVRGQAKADEVLTARRLLESVCVLLRPADAYTRWQPPQ